MKFTETDLINELAEMYPALPERKPGGVTTAEMCRVWGVGYRHAYNRLRELVEKDVLRVEVVRGDRGRGVMVFYKKE